jgi:hypothetical protein
MRETEPKPLPAVSSIRTKEETANLFKAEMPHIPGINEAVPPPPARLIMTPARWKALGGCIILLSAGAFVWIFRGAFVPGSGPPVSISKTAAPAPVEPPQFVPSFVPTADVVTAATLQQLPQPWSARQFMFIRPDTHANIPAMVIRLPGTSGDHAGAYWAFALAAPYSTCNLDYVTDLKALASQYGYSARHPMLVAACDGTLYDPLQSAAVVSGAYARGEVVQGPGVRPPLAIHIQVHGQSLVADRIEDSAAN